jgi:hypothetical protein
VPPLPYVPIPLPIPWPAPSPGVGTPVPTPAPAPLPSTLTPVIVAPKPGGTGNPAEGLAGLFKFSLDWRFLGALLFMLLTVGVVDEVWPAYVWPYVGILLLGLTLTNIEFSPRFAALFGS